MRLPTLFKRSSTGKIQQWTITVSGSCIQTEHGQVDGKLQTTEDLIRSGKNLGKSNATTPEEQAVLEAKARWEKQLKKGYVKHANQAIAGEVDEIIQGGVFPMLAHKFSEQGHKIVYPAFVQPKLDGIRCIAMIDQGTCTLWSRTRNPILGVPHIQRALANAFPCTTLTLDGELYHHDFKANFEEIVSFVTQETPKRGHEVVQYHVYDLIPPKESADMSFKERNEYISMYVGPLNKVYSFSFLKVVETLPVGDEDDLTSAFDSFIKQGYEGAMARNASGAYVSKRSYNLQKIKAFDDAEFPIIGVEQGRGKLAGHAIFICRAANGKEFTVKLKGDTNFLKRCYEDSSIWKDHNLTVKYQGFTNKNNLPRIPIGLRIRNYE